MNSVGLEYALYPVAFISSMTFARVRKLVEEICPHFGAPAQDSELLGVLVRSVAFGSVWCGFCLE